MKIIFWTSDVQDRLSDSFFVLLYELDNFINFYYLNYTPLRERRAFKVLRAIFRSRRNEWF